MHLHSGLQTLTRAQNMGYLKSRANKQDVHEHISLIKKDAGDGHSDEREAKYWLQSLKPDPDTDISYHCRRHD